MNASIHKKILYVFLAGAVATAAVAVIAIMTGGFTDTVGKTILTLLILISHTAVSILLLENLGKDREEPAARFAVSDLQITSVAALLFTGASLLIAILATWSLVDDGEVLSKIYATMFVLLFAVAHSEALWYMRVTKAAKALVPINLIFIGTVSAMLTYLLWLDGDPSDLFNRSLASLAIIDATLTLSVIVIYSIYLKTLPKEAKGKSLSTGWRIFWALVFILFILPWIAQAVFFLLFRGF